MQEIYHFIREQIRIARFERGLTQKEVAIRAGLVKSSYASIETGDSRPSIGTLYKILGALKLDISDVWPPVWEGSGVGDSALPEFNVINTFRIRQIFSLSQAESICLIFQSRGLTEPIFSMYTEEEERDCLFEAISTNRSCPEWEVLSKRTNGASVHFCLKVDSLESYLLQLAAIYLALWLNTFMFIDEMPKSRL